jgi:hypothetical protein
MEKELLPLSKAPQERNDAELEALMKHTSAFNYFQGKPAHLLLPVVLVR